jgi:Tfp pilus assembly protein PilF
MALLSASGYSRLVGRMLGGGRIQGCLLLVLSCGILSALPDTASTLSAARTALEQKQYATAERLYRKALTANPDSFEILNNLGITLYLEGKVTEATHYFQRALKYRYDPGTCAFLAAAKCRGRDLESARPILAKILSESIQDSRVLALVAPCFLDAGDPLGAIQAYRALQHSEQLSEDEVLIKLAKAYIAATQFFIERLQHAPDSTVYVQAIQKARDTGSANARDAFLLAAQHSPFLRADVSFTEAVTMWKEHPKDTGVLYVLSVLSGEEAMRQVLACEDEYPDSPWLEQFRADMLADQGREEEAVAKYEGLMQRRPNLPIFPGCVLIWPSCIGSMANGRKPLPCFGCKRWQTRMMSVPPLVLANRYFGWGGMASSKIICSPRSKQTGLPFGPD